MQYACCEYWVGFPENSVIEVINLALLDFPGILPKYFSSEWSFAQFHLPEVTRYIVAFGAQNTVMMVGLDGRYLPATSMD